MSDYIKREDAVKRFTFAVLDCLGMEPNIRASDVVKAIKSLPAADVVERKAVIEAMMKASTPAFDEDGKPTFLVDYVKVMEEL